MPETPLRPPSFWLADLDEALVPRPALEGDATVDVAIVGAGYTGLWTAYYLRKQEPSLAVAIVESEVAGFGASGRNGGWCSPQHDGVRAWLAGRRREGAVALQRAMFDAVDEIGRVTRGEDIDCDYQKSGFLMVATSDGEKKRVQTLIAEMRAHGFGEADYRWLDAREADAHVRIANTRGGIFSSHAAAVQPAKLARGLARAVERLGARIYERSPARAVAPGEVTTDRGRLRARIVLRCTEGYTPRLPGAKRELLPMHPLMIATECLPDAAWKEIGASSRIVFGNAHRVVTWAQRTTDGRLAIGRGGNYYYGSRIRDYFAAASPVFVPVREAMLDLFPSLADVEITHRWGGPLAIPRDMTPFVRFDRASGLGAAGGYVGSGVTTANLAGRTLADLVAGRDTERLGYPWVQHVSPTWEPEPLRWIGVKSVLSIGAAADRADDTGRPVRGIAGVFDRTVGH